MQKTAFTALFLAFSATAGIAYQAVVTDDTYFPVPTGTAATAGPATDFIKTT